MEILLFTSTPVLNRFLCLSLSFLLLLCVNSNGNIMMNYELGSNSNHIPSTAKYSGGSVRMRDNSYSRNYNYPSSNDDSSPNMNSIWGSGRPMNSLSSKNLQGAASNDFGYGASASDHFPAASENNGWSSHGHSQGGGKGENCNTALGLLGVLGLASYLQTVLRQMTTTAAAAPVVVIPPGRRKRNVQFPEFPEEYLRMKKYSNKEESVTDKIIPLLTAVGHARDSLIPMPCTQRPVCLVNKILLEELDSTGRAIGAQLSIAITKILKEVDKLDVVDKMISKATQTGGEGGDCIEMYPACPALHRLPSYAIPFSMRE